MSRDSFIVRRRRSHLAHCLPSKRKNYLGWEIILPFFFPFSSLSRLYDLIKSMYVIRINRLVRIRMKDFGHFILLPSRFQIDFANWNASYVQTYVSKVIEIPLQHPSLFCILQFDPHETNTSDRLRNKRKPPRWSNDGDDDAINNITSNNNDTIPHMGNFPTPS